MPRTREEILQERHRLKAEYGKLFDSVAALRGCESASDVRRVVHEEFVRWFDAGNAGPEERYSDIASEIWQLWHRHQGGGQLTVAVGTTIADRPPQRSARALLSACGSYRG
jgi:hypothetical protein